MMNSHNNVRLMLLHPRQLVSHNWFGTVDPIPVGNSHVTRSNLWVSGVFSLLTDLALYGLCWGQYSILHLCDNRVYSIESGVSMAHRLVRVEWETTLSFIVVKCPLFKCSTLGYQGTHPVTTSLSCFWSLTRNILQFCCRTQTSSRGCSI